MLPPMMLTLFIDTFLLCEFNNKKQRWRCQATTNSQASIIKSILLRSGRLEESAHVNQNRTPVYNGRSLSQGSQAENGVKSIFMYDLGWGMNCTTLKGRTKGSQPR